MIRKKYNCDDSEIIAVLQKAWASYATYQALFAIKSPIYTALYGTNQLTATAAAANMPDVHIRNTTKKLLRGKLILLTKKGLALFQLLKGYISKAFPNNENAQWILAGFLYYTKAAHKNWDKAKALFRAMIIYVTNNSAALLSGNNMPATFAADIAAFETDFLAKYAAFMQAKQDLKDATRTIRIAYNQLYEDLMTMLNTAKYLGFDDVTMKQFIFTEIYALVSTPGKSGTKGVLTDAATGLPIPNATVQVKALNKSVLTDYDGRYKLELPEGIHQIEATAPNYRLQILFPYINKGRTSTLNIQMQK